MSYHILPNHINYIICIKNLDNIYNPLLSSQDILKEVGKSKHFVMI